MDNLIYAGFVLAGAVTLLIEAYRNYNAPGAAHPFALHPILQTVEIRNLTTPAETMVGFAIYAACYLVVYAVVLGSAEILQLVLEANNSLNEVGAIGNALQPEDDALSLTGGGYEKPLLVSATLIAFLSLGAVRPVEATLRGVAHRLAGIPGGVYKVITELQNFDFVDSAVGYPTPLASSFVSNGNALTNNTNQYDSLRAEVARSLTAIDCLTEATSPSRSRLYFPLYQLATLTEVSKTLDDQITKLAAAIDAMPKRKDKEPAAEILQSVAQLTSAARQNTMAVFAVLFVRNNRSVFVSGRPFRGPATGTVNGQSSLSRVAPIESVRRAIALRHNAELNSFTIGLVLATLIGAAAIFWTYNAWYERNAFGPTPRSELSWAVCADARSDYDAALASHDAAAIQEASQSAEDRAAQNSIRCSDDDQRMARPDQVENFLLELRPTLASLTFFDTLRSTVLILTCVFFVLIGRESRIDDQSWPKDWSFRQLPFLTLLGMSFFPGIIAIVAVASTALLEQAFYTGGRLKSGQVTDLFLNNWIYFFMQFGTGLILGFGALVVMDKHTSDHWRWFVTMGVALMFAVILAVWAWCVTYFTTSDPSFFIVSPEQPVSRHLRDTLIFGVIPALFFVLFALFLELSEQGASTSAGARVETEATG